MRDPIVLSPYCGPLIFEFLHVCLKHQFENSLQDIRPATWSRTLCFVHLCSPSRAGAAEASDLNQCIVACKEHGATILEQELYRITERIDYKSMLLSGRKTFQSQGLCTLCGKQGHPQPDRLQAVPSNFISLAGSLASGCSAACFASPLIFSAEPNMFGQDR